MIVQQLLADVTGLPFPELMRQLILDPLGMEQSTFEQPLPRRDRTAAAVGHRHGGQPVRGKSFVYPEAQGGLWTTPSDLARFLIELQRANVGRPSRLLSQEIARAMLTSQIERHVGLGVFFDGAGDSRRIEHLGGNEGFSSRLSAFCNAGLGAVVMTNWHYGFLVDEVFRGIAREYAWPSYLPDPPTTIRMDPATCASYVGDYELRPDLHFRVRQGPDALSLEMSGQAPMDLVPRSATTFLMEAVNAEITFERSDTSEVTGAIFRQHDGTGGSAHWFATRRRDVE
jgi:CubicO group peptidase (beta-lactamase class C family)